MSTHQPETATYPAPTRPDYRSDKGVFLPFNWFALGVRDTFRRPVASLLYGVIIFLVSVAIVYTMSRLDLLQWLAPALAGFMVMGPALASGLYEKSRRLEAAEPVGFFGLLFARSKSPGQLWFVGLLLLMVMMLWMRAAFLLYALFFGMLPFPGVEKIAEILLTTPRGLLFLGVGTAVGGLFAAFSFAISVFSIPMLMNERCDAFTAMGVSMVAAWHNKGMMIVWGGIISALFVFSLATFLVGLIFVFPILGHGTWHGYRQMVAPYREPNRAA